MKKIYLNLVKTLQSFIEKFFTRCGIIQIDLCEEYNSCSDCPLFDLCIDHDLSQE